MEDLMRVLLCLSFAIMNFLFSDIALAVYNYPIFFYNKSSQPLFLTHFCISVTDSNGNPYKTCYPEGNYPAINLPVQKTPTKVLVQGSNLNVGYGLAGNNILIEAQNGSWRCSGIWKSSNPAEFYFFSETNCEIVKS
jgi:hypothetical protein